MAGPSAPCNPLRRKYSIRTSSLWLRSGMRRKPDLSGAGRRAHLRLHDGCAQELGNELHFVGGKPAQESARFRPESTIGAIRERCCQFTASGNHMIPLTLSRIMAKSPAPRKAAAASDPAYQQKNHDDQHHQADATARIISPSAAIRPSWNRGKQQDDQNQQQQKHRTAPPRPDEQVRNRCAAAEQGGRDCGSDQSQPR